MKRLYSTGLIISIPFATKLMPYENLPDWLNSQVWQELETIEEKENEQYITNVERIGIKGIVKGESRLLKRQLERRFGLLPE